MGKYTYINKMSRQTQEELFLLLVNAIANSQKTEAAKVLRDLLSEQEAAMIARRLKIAMLLDNGLSYQQIKREIKVSDGTISKIQLWLKTYGDGFRLALPKIKSAIVKPGPEGGPTGWRSLKKRYPMHFWPELVLKEIVRSANRKERDRLMIILNQMKDKTPLTRQLQTILHLSKNFNTAKY